MKLTLKRIVIILAIAIALYYLLQVIFITAVFLFKVILFLVLVGFAYAGYYIYKKVRN